MSANRSNSIPELSANGLLIVVFGRLLGHLLALDRVELGLTEAENFRRDFDAFVFVDEGDAFFQGHAAVRGQLDHVVSGLGARVGEVFALRDVHDDIDVAAPVRPLSLI